MIKPNLTAKHTDERVAVAARVYPEVAQQIESIAKEYDVTVSNVLRWALNDLLDKLRPESKVRN